MAVDLDTASKGLLENCGERLLVQDITAIIPLKLFANGWFCGKAQYA